jgi:hypothetical protein
MHQKSDVDKHVGKKADALLIALLTLRSSGNSTAKTSGRRARACTFNSVGAETGITGKFDGVARIWRPFPGAGKLCVVVRVWGLFLIATLHATAVKKLPVATTNTKIIIDWVPGASVGAAIGGV